MGGEHGQRPPEEHGQEPELPLPEAGQHALQFLDDFEDAFNSTPEFLQKLQELGYTEQQRAEMWHANKSWEVGFEKGDDSYHVKYNSQIGQTLDIRKTTREAGQMRSYESVTVRAKVPLEFPELGMGVIIYGRQTPDGIDEFFPSTPTALDRVKNFRATNLGNPHGQTPAQP
jgi:hypothetical protein